MNMNKIFVLLLALFVAAPAWAESYAYDAAGRLTRVTYADGKTIEYRYDPNGNVTELVADPPAVDAPVTPPPRPSGCGCTAVDTAALWGLLLGAGALRRRR
jgi:MYXO-CTERM domain-containing protein